MISFQPCDALERSRCVFSVQKEFLVVAQSTVVLLLLLSVPFGFGLCDFCLFLPPLFDGFEVLDDLINSLPSFEKSAVKLTMARVGYN